MAEMIKLFVNGSEVEVEAGKNLIDAIGAIGIEIPHLCYHPALGADGNCRMCLVGLEEGGPPLVPACKTQAAPGMKVLLNAEHIKKIQHDVLEFQLINHPIDCPVCDQAGECSLQDYYMEYDGQKSRMSEAPVSKSKKLDFGCGVIHDQERCVLCGRCVRFCRQITKTGELGIVNRTDDARVTIFPGRPLDNRYAVNVVDLCPVGAMTSADFRFKQRVWFLKKARGICHGCSKGCNITIDHNREKDQDDLIYRFRPLLNEEINGYFICDEGRLSYKQENENRLTEARRGKTAISLDDAVTTALKEMAKAEKIVLLISPDSSLEQMAAVKSLAEATGAFLSGFSDGYIKKGDGDDYLIQDDKAANRAGLALLAIDSSRENFATALEDAQMLINFNSNLSLSYDSAELEKLIKDKYIIAVTSHDSDFCKMANLAIPAASFTEYRGMIISCDNILQSFDKAIDKNSPPVEISEIAALLGGSLKNSEDQYNALKEVIVSTESFNPDTIPTAGLKLN
ncbi:MAG: (2Fe-2S)-binding protein [Deltaproteobacteria bacterium]|nr:(2Fe-2S)-binding protein [Deltaproteobacteria bacterium]